MEKDSGHGSSPKRQKTQGGDEEDISTIEDFSKPITIDKKMNIGIFWDVEEYSVLDRTHPDDIYEKFKSDLDLKEEGLLSIWAYYDEENPISAKYMCDKTWKSRLYFIAAGDKRSRRMRMFEDISLWKLDILPRPVGRLFVILDGVKSEDNVFYEMLQRLGSIGITTALYTLPPPSKDYQQQQNHPQWIVLRGEHWVQLVHPHFGRHRI